MAHPQAQPLRRLTRYEKTQLHALRLSRLAGALEVAHAKEILVVAEGFTFAEAARVSGMRSGRAVSALVGRFNERGLEAIKVAHAGGPAVIYGEDKKRKILNKLTSPPDREKDGTATWSIKTLQKTLRREEDGFDSVSAETHMVDVRRRALMLPWDTLVRKLRIARFRGSMKLTSRISSVASIMDG